MKRRLASLVFCLAFLAAPAAGAAAADACAPCCGQAAEAPCESAAGPCASLAPTSCCGETPGVPGPQPPAGGSEGRALRSGEGLPGGAPVLRTVRAPGALADLAALTSPRRLSVVLLI